MQETLDLRDPPPIYGVQSAQVVAEAAAAAGCHSIATCSEDAQRASWRRRALVAVRWLPPKAFRLAQNPELAWDGPTCRRSESWLAGAHEHTENYNHNCVRQTMVKAFRFEKNLFDKI